MSSCDASGYILRPKGCVRIRHLGFLANRRRAPLLPFCFPVLNAAQPSHTESETSFAQDRPRFGSVPNVAAPWRSSRDLRLPSSNSVLHPFSPEPPHETTNPSRLSVRFATCRSGALFLPPNKALRFQSPLKVLLPPPANYHPANPACPLVHSTTSTLCFSHHADTIAFA
jgi:hypothetical protein